MINGAELIDHTKLACVNDFKCTMGDCLYSCCYYWSIVIDDENINKFKNSKTELADKFLNSLIVPEEGSKNSKTLMKLCENGGCPMLDSDHACSIHRNFGADYLSETCTKFPRAATEAHGVLTSGLTLGCYDAALLALTPKNGQIIASATNEAAARMIDTDFIGYAGFLVRGKVFDMLQDRSVGLQARIAVISLMLDKLAKLPLEKASISEFTEIMDFHARNLEAYSQSLTKITAPDELRQSFDSWLAHVIWNYNHRKLPFENFYSKFAESFMGFDDRENLGKYRNKHAGTLFSEYSYLLENYLIITLYNDVFPFKHTDYSKAYRYLILKINLIVSIISVFYRDKPHISEKDIIFAISYFSRSYEHTPNKIDIFNSFCDENENFNLAYSIAMLNL